MDIVRLGKGYDRSAGLELTTGAKNTYFKVENKCYRH